MTRVRVLMIVVGAVCLFQLSPPRTTSAQAWLPPRGEGYVTLTYQHTWADGHLLGTGERASGANAHDRVFSNTLTTDIDFGLTDRIAAHLALPFIAARYAGGAPHLVGVTGGLTTIDNGYYHGAFQDFRFGGRLQLLARPLAVTPFVDVIVPSQRYESRGHSVIGQDLHALVLGTNMGGLLDGVVTGLYYQGQVSYAVPERVAGYRPSRSRVDLEVGYFLKPRLSLRIHESFQTTHDGINFLQPGQTRVESLNHDRIHRYDFLDLGGGLAFAIADSWQIFTSGGGIVWGQNVHPHTAFLVGVNWHFATPLALIGSVSSQRQPPSIPRF